MLAACFMVTKILRAPVSKAQGAALRKWQLAVMGMGEAGENYTCSICFVVGCETSRMHDEGRSYEVACSASVGRDRAGLIVMQGAVMFSDMSIQPAMVPRVH